MDHHNQVFVNHIIIISQVKAVDGGIVIREHEWIHCVEGLVASHKLIVVQNGNEGVVIQKILDDQVIQLFFIAEDFLEVVDKLNK